MIEQTGRVVAVDDARIWVEVTPQAGCKSCSAQENCGQSLLQKVAGSRMERLVLDKTQDIQVGDWVLVGMEGAAVFNASLLVYGLPLSGLLIGAMAASLAGASEPVVLLVALLSLTGAVGLVKTLSRRFSCNSSYHPQLLRRL
ncbi:MAG: SoxR reducing system RseC family protein [Hahellaceae bacterium]|jgi:sigma-E factor negative regulatory protein RseC|nr:SoxR reducing system RseC family protein [Hahellaceae bacterium]